MPREIEDVGDKFLLRRDGPAGGSVTALIIVVALGILLTLLIQYPRRTLQVGCSVVGLLVLGLVTLWYFLVHRPSRVLQEREAKVLIGIQYLPGSCSAQEPLRVEITNTGSMTVKKVEWHLEVYRPGFSNNLAERGTRYESDRILAPGQAYQLCVRFPELSYTAQGLAPASLSYVIGSKWVEWTH